MIDHIKLVHGPVELAQYVVKCVNRAIGHQAPSQHRFAQVIKAMPSETVILIRVEDQIFHLRVNMVPSYHQ